MSSAIVYRNVSSALRQASSACRRELGSVEAAYRRGDMFRRRRQMMDDVGHVLCRKTEGSLASTGARCEAWLAACRHRAGRFIGEGRISKRKWQKFSSSRRVEAEIHLRSNEPGNWREATGRVAVGQSATIR